MSQEQFMSYPDAMSLLLPKEVLERLSEGARASNPEATLTLRPVSELVVENLQDTPLISDHDGTLRVRGSRVTLDVIVHQFEKGSTAEQIQEDFPSLSLRDVYGAIHYYLNHEEEIDEYLKRQIEAAGETRRFVESKNDNHVLRERIRARHKQLLKK